MVEILRRYFDELAQSVLKPIWDWVMARSWITRAGILVIIIFVGGSIEYPSVPSMLYQQGFSLSRVLLAPSKGLPLSTAAMTQLADTNQRLSNVVANDLLPSELNGITMTPWSAAQAVVALGGAKGGRLNSGAIATYVRANYAPDCACWTEVPSEKAGSPVVFISGWMMTALAQLGMTISEKELEFIFSKQDARDGWWPIFSDSQQYQHASTYTTAWVVIGLAEQVRKGLLPADDMGRAKEAITRAANWLLQHHDSNAARWKPYPNLSSTEDTASESISGLVIHALHVSGAVNTSVLDREWLENLPDRRIAASDEEKYYVEVKTPTQVLFDHFVQIKLPWVLVATVDAYESGDIWQRGKALRWIERAISDQSVVSADANASNWWRAELLYALKTTQSAAEGLPPARPGS